MEHWLALANWTGTRHGCIADKASGDEFCGGLTCKNKKVRFELRKDGLCAYHSSSTDECIFPQLVTGIRLIRAQCLSAAGLIFFLLYVPFPPCRPTF